MLARQQAKACFCNQCKEHFTRRELDAHFLCEKCRVMPGVRGHRDPKRRGHEYGSPQYWERTKNQLRIVSDEQPVPIAPVAPSASRPTTHTTVKQWQYAVLAEADLPAEVKVALIRLSFFADWKTGGNCWPSHKAVALAIGRSVKQVRNLLHQGAVQGWIAVEHRSLRGRGRTTNRYQLQMPSEPVLNNESSPRR